MCECIKTPDICDPVEDKKNELRAQIRRKRKALPAKIRAKAAEDVNVFLSKVIDPYHVLAAYIPNGEEINILPFLDRCILERKEILIPKLGPGLARAWAWYRGHNELEESGPGRPLQPRGEALEQKALSQAQCIIVPALATDENGTRLGQGGGWYDRVLTFAPHDAPIIAIHYDDEYFRRALPCLPHDRPVTMTITPQNIYHA